jgi:hypothetical protein
MNPSLGRHSARICVQRGGGLPQSRPGWTSMRAYVFHEFWNFFRRPQEFRLLEIAAPSLREICQVSTSR